MSHNGYAVSLTDFQCRYCDFTTTNKHGLPQHLRQSIACYQASLQENNNDSVFDDYNITLGSPPSAVKSKDSLLDNLSTPSNKRKWPLPNEGSVNQDSIVDNMLDHMLATNNGSPLIPVEVAYKTMFDQDSVDELLSYGNENEFNPSSEHSINSYNAYGGIEDLG